MNFILKKQTLCFFFAFYVDFVYFGVFLLVQVYDLWAGWAKWVEWAVYIRNGHPTPGALAGMREALPH